MRLVEGLPATAWAPPRGDGDSRCPDTGEESLPHTAFLTKDEVLGAKRDLHHRPGSIFLGRVDQQMIGIRDNRHIITLAGSRSGKSACVLVPNLLLYPGSALVIDPKGELAEHSADHRARVLGQKVAVLDPFRIVRGSAADYRMRHNPLAEIEVRNAMGEDNAELIDDAALIAEALITDTGNDQYWSIAARNLVAALALASILKCAPALASIRHDLLRDSAGLARLFEEMRAYREIVGPGDSESVHACAELISRTGAFMLGRDPKERSSVIATAVEQLAFLESPPMRRLFEGHDVGLGELKAGPQAAPVTIYLVLPAGRIGTHSRWLRLMIALALAKFERDPFIPDPPVLLILEEFAALGHLRPVEQAAGFIAGYGVRLWSVLQDLSQLKNHYKEGWETFIGNAGILQTFSLTDHSSLDYVSKRLGDTTVEVITPQDVTQRARDGGDSGLKRDFRSVPLMATAEVAMAFRRLSVDGSAVGGRALVLWADSRPFAVDRVHWSNLR